MLMGSLRVPQTPWLGPGRRPKSQRIGLFLMALGWGYGGVDYLYPELVSAKDSGRVLTGLLNNLESVLLALGFLSYGR